MIVGVNAARRDDEPPLEILRIDPALERKQIDRLAAVRSRRDGAEVESALGALRESASDAGANLMPALLECARAHASEGEIVGALQSVFGTDTERPSSTSASLVNWRAPPGPAHAGLARGQRHGCSGQRLLRHRPAADPRRR